MNNGKLDLYLEETNTKVNEVLKIYNNSIDNVYICGLDYVLY